VVVAEHPPARRQGLAVEVVGAMSVADLPAEFGHVVHRL
jgi:hypothetical protein